MIRFLTSFVIFTTATLNTFSTVSAKDDSDSKADTETVGMENAFKRYGTTPVCMIVGSQNIARADSDLATRITQVVGDAAVTLSELKITNERICVIVSVVLGSPKDVTKR